MGLVGLSSWRPPGLGLAVELSSGPQGHATPRRHSTAGPWHAASQRHVASPSLLPALRPLLARCPACWVPRCPRHLEGAHALGHSVGTSEGLWPPTCRPGEGLGGDVSLLGSRVSPPVTWGAQVGPSGALDVHPACSGAPAHRACPQEACAREVRFGFPGKTVLRFQDL